MPIDCPYCGDTVPDDAYVHHLRRQHADELTPIDDRRVGRGSGGAQGRPLVLYAGIAGVLLLFVLGYGFAFLLADTGPGTAAVQPDSAVSVHEHGLIAIEHDGRPVDLGDPQYLEADECFHFHGDGGTEDGGDGHDHDHGTPPGTQVWHTHCENVTVEYALETLGMDVTADGITLDGREYSATEVSVTVDGEPVDPQTYVLDGVEPVDAAADGAGDDVRVVLRSSG